MTTAPGGDFKPRSAKSADSLVYFFRPVGERGPVKIGNSVAPKRRLIEMAAWSPIPLELVVSFPGGERVERQFHGYFSHLHLHHEWFRADPALDAVLEALVAGTFDFSVLPDPLTLNYAVKHTPEVREGMSYTRRLMVLSKLKTISVPPEVMACAFTADDEPEEAARKRAVVKEYVDRVTGANLVKLPPRSRHRQRKSRGHV